VPVCRSALTSRRSSTKTSASQCGMSAAKTRCALSTWQCCFGLLTCSRLADSSTVASLLREYPGTGATSMHAVFSPSPT
jgi:hypothetical protein